MPAKYKKNIQKINEKGFLSNAKTKIKSLFKKNDEYKNQKFTKKELKLF